MSERLIGPSEQHKHTPAACTQTWTNHIKSTLRGYHHMRLSRNAAENCLRWLNDEWIFEEVRLHTLVLDPWRLTQDNSREQVQAHSWVKLADHSNNPITAFMCQQLYICCGYSAQCDRYNSMRLATTMFFTMSGQHIQTAAQYTVIYYSDAIAISVRKIVTLSLVLWSVLY